MDREEVVGKENETLVQSLFLTSCTSRSPLTRSVLYVTPLCTPFRREPKKKADS